MTLLLALVILYNGRKIVTGYKYCWHWVWVLVPGFFTGVSLMMLAQIITTHVYFGTSLWWPDWRCPDFLILKP